MKPCSSTAPNNGGDDGAIIGCIILAANVSLFSFGDCNMFEVNDERWFEMKFDLIRLVVTCI